MSFIPPVTHQVKTMAAEGKTRLDRTKGLAIHGCLLQPRADVIQEGENSLVYLKGCSSKPGAEVQKQQQQPWSLQLQLVFHSQGKVDLKAFVPLGRGWKQTKKGRGRIKVILNH